MINGGGGAVVIVVLVNIEKCKNVDVLRNATIRGAFVVRCRVTAC